jgi:hypothetical protein
MPATGTIMNTTYTSLVADALRVNKYTRKSSTLCRAQLFHHQLAVVLERGHHCPSDSEVLSGILAREIRFQDYQECVSPAAFRCTLEFQGINDGSDK